MITATSDSKPRELVPAGNYLARCYSMVHIGTVSEMYMGKPKEQNKVSISWELPTEQRIFNTEKGEQPFSISREFTLSMYEKANLRKFLEGWRGKAFKEDEAKSFDITKLLGVACMLNVIHQVSKTSGKSYAMIASISTLPKGMACPAQINPSFEFSLEAYDADKFSTLPEWIKEKISKSKEFIALKMNETKVETFATSTSDDLPF